MNVVLFTLSGGGDTYRFVVPKLAFDWMQTVKPGHYKVPDDVIKALEPFKTDFASAWEGITEEQYASGGSCENDVAIALSAWTKDYNSFREINAACVTNGWVIFEEYDGYIY